MQYSATQLAIFLNGEIVGDPEITVNRLAKIEEGEPGALAFLSNPKYTPFLYTTKASIVLVNRTFVPDKEFSTTLIKVDDAYDSIGKIMKMVQQAEPEKTGIESPSYVASTAKIGNNVYIGAFSYISDNVVIEDNVKIYPNTWLGKNSFIGSNSVLFTGVKIYPETQIGNRCVLHAGVVVGSDGFGFVPQADGTYQKLPQLGNVVIEDDVEIGANSTIDCATMGSTLIKKGVKLDNLVQVGHNCVIGQNTVIAALSGIAGSSSVGDNCIIAGQVGIAGHLKVGNKVTLAAKAGITTNIPDNSIQMGVYSFEAAKYRKSHAAFKNLPDLLVEIRQLKKEIEILKQSK